MESVFWGKFFLSSATIEEDDITDAILTSAGITREDMFIDFLADGAFKMATFGPEGGTIDIEGTFTVNDNTATLTVRDEDGGGDPFDAVIDGNKITVDMGEYTPLLIFERP